MNSLLPNPEAPTLHPFYAANRHPIQNTFAVMPVSKAAGTNTGDVINLNLATYTDPYAESDFHRLVASRPRWMQGILVKIDEIVSLRDTQEATSHLLTSFPGDRLFAGTSINHGAQMPVVGVLHPQRSGWLAFAADAFGTEDLKTIADLKARLGKISIDEATTHNKTRHRFGTFTLPNGTQFS